MMLAYLLEKIEMEKELLHDLVADQAERPESNRTIVILASQIRIQTFEELVEELQTGEPTVRKVREIPRHSGLRLIRQG